MASSVGYPVLTINNWSPPDKSGYLEQLSKRAPALIAPADAPLYKMLERAPAVGYQQDWLTDDLQPIQTEGGLPFETEPLYSTTLYRNRLMNIIQMFRKVWSIAEYTEIIAKNGGVGGGIKSEIARQIMLLMKALSRNIERTIASNITGGLEGASGATSSTLYGYFALITASNATLTAANANIVNTVDTIASPLTTSLDETTFQNKILQLHNNGASADLHCIVQPALMVQMGRTFLGRSNVRETVERGSHKIDTLMEKYVAPVGGEVTIEPDRSIGESCLLFDEEQLRIGEADPIRIYKNDRGSFQNNYGRATTYITLECGNPQASGGWITANTPAAAGV